MSVRVVHQFDVTVVTLTGERKLLPPSVDCTQSVSTNEFAGPTRKTLVNSRFTSHSGLDDVAASWLS